MLIKHIFFLLFTIFFLFVDIRVDAQNLSNENDVKVRAEQFFLQQNYNAALPLYSQLLSLHKNNFFYSYRFGVCLLYTDRRDPELSIKYIKFAINDLEGKDAIDVFYHLGVALHQAYRFGEAAESFQTFRQKATNKNTYIDDAYRREIMCKSGVSLLQDISDIIVIKKNEAMLNSFFRSYNIEDFGGKIGPKPEFLKSKLDKKSKEPELVFVSNSDNYLYYSSFGKKNKSGRDIYRVRELGNGNFSEPEKLSDAINTSFDENYPFLLPDGKTLYFCSKGHNSMGGYDIFKSVFDKEKNDWTDPINIDFAINTPFDDILFITDPAQKYAWFSSYRNSADGRIMVYLVRIDKKNYDNDNINIKLLAASNINNNEGYEKTIKLLQSKSNLEVNSSEDIVVESPKIVANTDNAKYNIPENPTSEELVDIAYKHVNIAKKNLESLKEKRNIAYILFDEKVTNSQKIKNETQELHKKAIVESNAAERKNLMLKSNELAKKSLKAENDENIAKQISDKYTVATDKQEKNLNELKQQAGFVLKLANSRQIDTSIYVLKNLIDNVNIFNVDIAEEEIKISADKRYLSVLENKISKNSTIKNQISAEIAELESQVKSFDNESKKEKDEDIKSELENNAALVKKQANSKTIKLQELNKLIDEQKAELENLKKHEAIFNNFAKEIANFDLNKELKRDSLVISKSETASNNNIKSEFDSKIEIKDNVIIEDKSKFEAEANIFIAKKIDSLKNVSNDLGFRMNNIAQDFYFRNKNYENNLEKWNFFAKNSDNNESKEQLSAELKKQNKKLTFSKSYFNKLAQQKADNDEIMDRLDKKNLKKIVSIPSDSSSLCMFIININNQIDLKNSKAKSDSAIFAMQCADIVSQINLLKSDREIADNDLSGLENALKADQIRLKKTKNDKKKTQIKSEISKKSSKILILQEDIRNIDNDINELNNKLAEIVEFGHELKKIENINKSNNDLFSDNTENTTFFKPSDYAILDLPTFNDIAILQPNNNVGLSNIQISDEQQDFVQSDFYNKAAQILDMRISILKNDISEDVVRKKQIDFEIAALETTSSAYKREADAYLKNAENNCNLKGIKPNRPIQTFTEQEITDFHIAKYENNIFIADSLRETINDAMNIANKQNVLNKISNFEDAAKRHYLMSSDIYGVWNNSQFEKNNIIISENAIKSNEEISKANDVFLKARKLRSKAFNEKDFYIQKKLLLEAKNLENEAILIQTKILSDNKIDNINLAFQKAISKVNDKLNSNNLGSAEKNENIIQLNKLLVSHDSVFSRDGIKNFDRSGFDKKQSLHTESKLFYRIQIAASRVEVEDNAGFKNLDVVSEKSGVWYQYMTGCFNIYSDAQTQLVEIRNLGFIDAFVVAYFDGKRVPVYEAKNIEQKSNIVQTETAITNQKTNNINGNFSISDVSGLVYSVQCGVYAKTRNSNSLFGISPLIEERMQNGYYRYYAGVFKDINDANIARNNIRNSGIADAFVVVLYNGKKISMSDAQNLIHSGVKISGNLYNDKLKTDLKLPGNKTKNEQSSKIIFKIQLGAFSKEVPVDIVNTMIAVAGIGIETEKRPDGITIYTAGSFANYDEANRKKNEIVEKGIKDSFLIAYKNGNKISIKEAKAIIGD